MIENTSYIVFIPWETFVFGIGGIIIGVGFIYTGIYYLRYPEKEPEFTKGARYIDIPLGLAIIFGAVTMLLRAM